MQRGGLEAALVLVVQLEIVERKRIVVLPEQLEERIVRAVHRADIGCLAPHHIPGQHRHKAEDRDDNPRIDRDGFDDDAEIAEAESGLLFILTISDKFGIAALRNRVGENERRRPRDFRKPHFVHLAAEVGKAWQTSIRRVAAKRSG